MTCLAVTSLTLSHFRSHKHAQIDAGVGPVAIFGPNGAGKTNLLEAISLLSPGRGLRRAAASDLSRQPESLGWKVSASLESLGQKHEVSTWSENGASRQVTIDDKAAPQLALGRILRIVWLVPAMDRLWTEGADGRRRFLDRMVLSFEPKHGEAVLHFEKSMRERNRLLKENIRDVAWYDALERQMAQSGAAIYRNRRFALDRIVAAQTGARTAFPAAELSLTGPDEQEPAESEADLAAAFSDGRGRDLAAGRTLSGPHRSDLVAIYSAKGIEARQCSTGEQKALLLSLVLSNARALAADFGAPPVLLLDEVSAHLDAGRRASLYEEIIALGAQAWMTGTGAELFADLGSGVARFVVEDADGQSKTKPF